MDKLCFTRIFSFILPVSSCFSSSHLVYLYPPIINSQFYLHILSLKPPVFKITLYANSVRYVTLDEKSGRFLFSVLQSLITFSNNSLGCRAAFAVLLSWKSRNFVFFLNSLNGFKEAEKKIFPICCMHYDDLY